MALPYDLMMSIVDLDDGEKCCGRPWIIDAILLQSILLNAGDFDFLLSEKVKVRRLKRRDIKTATNTLIRAIADDPLDHYIFDTPDARKSLFARRARKLQMAISARWWVHRRIGFTVNHGRAVVVATRVPATDKPSKIDQQLGKLITLATRILERVSMSKQQQQRAEEVGRKLRELVSVTLGDRTKEMRSVNSLATDPSFQRRGYGGALVDFVTQLADIEGRSTFLLSSNPLNTEFYNSHGFFEIAAVEIGGDSPTWKKPPLSVPLMMREYNSSLGGRNEKSPP